MYCGFGSYTVVTLSVISRSVIYFLIHINLSHLDDVLLINRFVIHVNFAFIELAHESFSRSYMS